VPILAAMIGVMLTALAPAIAVADELGPVLGAFGFPDAHGSRLIVADSLAAPESLTRAIAPGGRVYHIRYAGKQAAKPGGHMRATSQDFAFTEGHVFRVARGHVEADASCLLTTDALFAGCRPETLRTFESPPHCSAELVQRIADLRERAVVRSWILARLGTDRLVVLLEFEPRGTQALGSLAIVSADAIGFNDYPAEVEKEGDSVYRVDDEGVMSPEGFEVLFAYRKGQSEMLGISWGSTESLALSLFQWTGGPVLKELVTGNRYVAPM
jgi:hypothetical protein